MAEKPKRQIKYSFTYIENCNMCGSPVESHRTLGKRLNQSQGKFPRKKTGIAVTIVKCSQCDLVYSNPLPIPASIQDHYGIEPENYWNKEYFTVDDSSFQGELQIINQLLKYSKGAKALDIGAGLGKGMIVLEGAGFETYGCEASETFYKMAVEQMKISPERLQRGMIEEVSYPENFFDFIAFKAVLEHLYDPSASIEKALSWLKPQGLLQIEVPSSRWLINDIMNLFYTLTGTDYVGNLSPMHNPYHLYEFGLKSFQQHAATHNYEVALHQYYICDTYLPKFVDYFVKPYMGWSDRGMQLCVWIRKR